MKKLFLIGMLLLTGCSYEIDSPEIQKYIGKEWTVISRDNDRGNIKLLIESGTVRKNMIACTDEQEVLNVGDKVSFEYTGRKGAFATCTLNTTRR